MCIILEFSKELGTSILVNWLSTKDFLNFDVSLCNRRDREIFRVWMKENNFQFQCVVFNNQVVFPLCAKIILWALDRCFNLETLFHRLVIGNKMIHIFNAVDHNTRCKLLKSMVNVKHLKLCGALGGLSDVVSCFKNIEYLECTNASNEIVQQVAACCPLLKMFNMVKCYEVTTDTLVKLVRNCIHLEELKLQGCHFYSGSSFMVAITVHSVELKKLTIKGGHDISDRDLMMFALHKRSHMEEFMVVKNLIHQTTTTTFSTLHSKSLINRLMAGQGANLSTSNSITPLHCCKERMVPGLFGDFLKSNGYDEHLSNKSSGSFSQACKDSDTQPQSAAVSSCDGQYGLELGEEDIKYDFTKDSH